jgi:hypothetical protein
MTGSWDHDNEPTCCMRGEISLDSTHTPKHWKPEETQVAISGTATHKPQHAKGAKIPIQTTHKHTMDKVQKHSSFNIIYHRQNPTKIRLFL